MNPIFLKVPMQSPASFSVRKEMLPNINSWWHYHPEIELIHIERGEGTLFVGDTMHHFHPGDVVILGGNLPHYWRYESQEKNENTSYATVIHFMANLWSKYFGELPEMQKIKALIERCSHGVRVQGSAAHVVAEMMNKVYKAEGLSRVFSLLEALDALSACADFQMLSSASRKNASPPMGDTRIRTVLEFTLQHLNEKINLKAVADIAGLTENSFCRFFKSNTGKTYFEFLNEARIAQACKLLRETGLSIKEVCFNSGFDNFSCFFSKFKLIMGKTPLQYKREVL